MQNAEPETVLVGIPEKFTMPIVRFELAPKMGHIPRAMRGWPAVAAAVVGNNIVKHDETAVANEFPVKQKILFHALVTMIAIDKEKIDRLSGERAPDFFKRSRRVGRSIDQMQALVRPAQKTQDRAVHNEQVNADDRSHGFDGASEEQIGAAVGRPNFAHGARSFGADVINGRANFFGILQSAAGHGIPREGKIIFESLAALKLRAQFAAVAGIQSQRPCPHIAHTTDGHDHARIGEGENAFGEGSKRRHGFDLEW
jgi:hypothetical protein